MTPMPFDVELQLRRHGAALRALAGEIVRDPSVADDAVQEVWLGALRRPPSHGSAPGGWLATALHNVVRGFGRRERRAAQRERAVAEARGVFAEDHAAVLAREEQAQRLLAAVTKLSAPFRETIWQRYFEGLAPREIAARAGVPCTTVKSRLQRGLQQLRTQLANDGESGRRGALAVAFGHGTTAWPGVLLMTTWTKSMAVVTALAAAGVLVWSFADLAAPSAAPPAPAGEFGAVTATAPTVEPAQRDAAASPDERTPGTAGVPVADPTSREVRVVDEGGEAVTGATVLFVRPGFTYADLAPADADRYSRSTESFLRDFGIVQLTDGRGSARIPIAAAQQVVVARKGNLCGTNWPRTDGAFQKIIVRSHHTLVVETVDARGTSVPHVKVVGVPLRATSLRNAMSHWDLGTTDDHGRLTQTLAAPTEAQPVAQWQLHAELLDDLYGQQIIDATAPPAFVRLILPDTGTVRVRLQNADGSAPDRRVLDSIVAELGLPGAQPRAAFLGRTQGGPPRIGYARLGVEGDACFENLVLGQQLQLRFPGLIVTKKTFAGPTAAERVVTIVHTMTAEHPFVFGTLVDADGRPMDGATFTLMAPTNPDLQLSRGGKTDAQGRFVTWLVDRCIDRRDVVLQFGMDWVGTAPAREATVRVAGPMLGRIDVGTIVIPNPK